MNNDPQATPQTQPQPDITPPPPTTPAPPAAAAPPSAQPVPTPVTAPVVQAPTMQAPTPAQGVNDPNSQIVPPAEEKGGSKLGLLIGILAVLLLIAGAIWYFGYYRANQSATSTQNEATSQG